MLWFIVVAMSLCPICSINLNTSYVMVHLSKTRAVATLLLFKYIICYGSSPSLIGQLFSFIPFKYIICYGSSNLLITIHKKLYNLNTSYVMVHQRANVHLKFSSTYLNTSYVMVHHKIYNVHIFHRNYLNTSYVMVHP